METLAETTVALSPREQRLLETYASTLTFDEARSSCRALIERLACEGQQIKNPNTVAITGWYRVNWFRNRKIHAVQQFAEQRLPLESGEWDDMRECYEINTEQEGL